MKDRIGIGRFVDAKSAMPSTRYALAWVTCPYCKTKQLIEIGGICRNCKKAWFRLIAMWNPLDSQPLESKENVSVYRNREKR